MNNKMTRFGLGIAAVTASLGFFVATASAQLAPPPAAPKAPVTAPSTTVPAAPKAVTTPTTAPKTKAEKKPASPCKGLDQAACGAKTECSFTTPTKVNKATGKVQAPYCHLTAKGAVKKVGDAAKAAVTKAPATTAPAAAAKAPVTAPAAGAAPVTAPAKKTP